MAIRRQKLDRKINLTSRDGELVDMPPGWAFTIICPHRGEIHLNFNRYRERGRDELAGHMRDCIWKLRHEVTGKTLLSYEYGLRPFWRFLDDISLEQKPITRLKDIDHQVLERYLVWLGTQISTKGKNKGNIYSLSAQRTLYFHIKILLSHCQRYEPSATSKELSFPVNPFPNSNRLVPSREPYSSTEQKQIIAALNVDLKRIHCNDVDPLSDSQVTAVYLLILGLATGRNLESLLDLRRDSLQAHPLADRDFLVTKKRRGHSTLATSMSKSSGSRDQKSIETIPSNISEHFKFFCARSSSLVADATSDIKDNLFLWRITRDDRKGLIVRLQDSPAGRFIRTFAARHNLTDDSGTPLRLNISRLRPTMATELYRRTHDVRCVQRALGHASVETTIRHYISQPIEAERDHAIVIAGMVGEFTRSEINGKVLIAADGTAPIQNIRNLLAGGYNTAIARCQNPFRVDESVCKKFFTCFRCPNMCVFEDDLWRLLSFYNRLLAERQKISPSHWVKTYGPIIRRIDIDILPHFPITAVNAARLKAKDTPHPTWKSIQP